MANTNTQQSNGTTAEAVTTKFEVTTLPVADAVLFVTDASSELTMPEVAFLRTVVALCPRVLVVTTKIDLHPEWRKIHELDAIQTRQNPGMMPAKVTDANDRHAHRHDGSSQSLGRARPTMVMPAASAAATIASPSIMRVLPASTDNRVAPAARMASMVDTPTTGTSKRMSWLGLATLTIRTPAPAS